MKKHGDAGSQVNLATYTCKGAAEHHFRVPGTGYWLFGAPGRSLWRIIRCSVVSCRVSSRSSTSWQKAITARVQGFMASWVVRLFAFIFRCFFSPPPRSQRINTQGALCPQLVGGEIQPIHWLHVKIRNVLRRQGVVATRLFAHPNRLNLPPLALPFMSKVISREDLKALVNIKYSIKCCGTVGLVANVV
jgi:hypothetical protein